MKSCIAQKCYNLIFYYNDVCILVRGNISNIGHNEAQVVFKNCALFTKRVTNIDRITIDDTEDLDLVMPIYNLLEKNSNYSDATGSL